MNALRDALSLGWVGSLIGIVGIVIGFLFYRLSRQRSVIGYRTIGLRILGGASADLAHDITVQFRGRTVPRVTRSVLVAWNDGERTVLGQDIVQADPLRIQIDEGHSILSLTIIKTTRAINNIRCTINPSRESEAHIAFDFLDPKDGLVVEILHSGIERNPKMAGTVRGIPSGPKDLGRIQPRGPRPKRFPYVRADDLVGYATMAFALAVMLGGAIYPLLFSNGEAVGSKSNVAGYASAGLVTFYCVALWINRKRYPSTLQCEQLE